MIALDEADADESGDYDEEELSALTRAQIVELAESLEYEGITSNMTKKQMIAAFLAAQSAAGTDDDDQQGGG